MHDIILIIAFLYICYRGKEIDALFFGTQEELDDKTLQRDQERDDEI